MSAAMLRELTIAFERAQNDRAIVILTSARDGIFSAGFDTKVLARKDPQEVFEMVRMGADLAARVLAFPYPVMHACGLTRGGLYAHFVSKGQLYGEACNLAALSDVMFNEYLGIPATSAILSSEFAFLALDIASKRPEVRAAFTEAFTSISKRLSGRSEANARCIESRSLSAAALIVGALAVANTMDSQALKQKLIASCKENASTLLNDTERSTPTFFWEPAL
jgi:AcrR family transcriptional regulator